MHQFSIITPTFNRAKYLPRIYDCLCLQGNADFEWIIIDDGSIDNTKEVVFNFDKIFKIKYLYKENAGKPSALNNGVQIANSYILFSLDDDDMLCPNALEIVWKYFDVKTSRFEHDCVCLSGLCKYENGDVIGKNFPHDYFVSDHIRYRYNKEIYGDKCEFYVTNIFKTYPFPILENEKGIGESVVHNRIALSHNTLYVNFILCEKQFLQGGLSTQNYNFKNPLGSELSHNEASIPPFKLKLRIKNSAKYILFARINHKKQIYSAAKNKGIFPLGILAYCMLVFILFLKKFRIFKMVFKKNIQHKKITYS